MTHIKRLKKLAKDFNLNFNKEWFKFVWVTKEQEILTEYLSDCRDPAYEKYGHSIKNRMKNLGKFSKSREYKNLIKRYGGQMVSKKVIEEYKNISKRIPQKEISDKILKFSRKTSKKIGSANKIAVLTETKLKKEKEHLLNQILFHEWIHVLLEWNKLRPKNWKYNEGLVTYLQEFSFGNLDKLEIFRDKTNYDFQKQYFIYAIKFRNLLRGIKSPAERKKKLKNISKNK
jgi:hypothetical protein